MNKTDYHITKVMPDIKMKSIVRIEGICPVCNGKNTYYTTKYRCDNKIWQNSYSCKDCHSEWMGNTYNNGFRRITSEEERQMSVRPNPILQGFAYIFSV